MKAKRESLLGLIAELISAVISTIIFITIFNSKLMIIIGTSMGIVSMIITILSWIYKSYAVTNNMFYYNVGIINRRRIQIDKRNITALDVSRSFKQRIFRLNDLKINTTNESEDLHLVLTNKSLNTLLESFGEIKNKDEAKYIYEMSKSDNILFAVSHGGFIEYAVAIIGVLGFLYNFKFNVTKIGKLEVILGIVIYLVIVKVIVIVWNYIKYYGFHITTDDNGLKVEAGLFNKNNRTLRTGRVSAVTIRQTLLLRLLRKSSISVCLIGVEEDEKDISLIYPVIDNKNIEQAITEILPEFYYKGDNKKVSNKHFIAYKTTRYGSDSKLFYLEGGIFTKKVSLINREFIDDITYTTGLFNIIRNTKKLSVSFAGQRINTFRQINGVIEYDSIYTQIPNH